MSELTEKLAGLLEAQAMGQSQQHLQRGQQAVAQIQEETRTRIRMLLDGEEARFQHEATHLCRQLLQGAQLRMDADMDRVRWALVQDVLSGLRIQLAGIPEDRPRYRRALQHYLAEAANSIPGTLRAEVSPADLEWLRGEWQEMCDEAANGREVGLSPLGMATMGGMMVSDASGERRLDNTFEGRLMRLESQLHAHILKALFETGAA